MRSRIASKLLDPEIIRTGDQACELVTNTLESSTEYSVIAKDLDGRTSLWNEGARRMYGYEPEEVAGKANSDMLHTPASLALGRPRQIMEAALREGKWEGII